MLFGSPPGTDFASFWSPPGIPKAIKMRLKSVPDLPKLIFGQISYFVARANEIHNFFHLRIHQKSSKSQPKEPSTQELRKKEGFRRWLLAILDDFWGARRGPQIIKSQKNAKIDQKKEQKKLGYMTS